MLCLHKTRLLGKAHLSLSLFSECWYLSHLIAPNISFLWSLSSFCHCSFLHILTSQIQVWIFITLNNQHIMPALILRRMAFTEGSSAGSSVLRPIVSVIEPWLSEHSLFYSQSTCNKMLCGSSDLAYWALRSNWPTFTKLFQKGFWGRHMAVLRSVLMVSIWPNYVPKHRVY